MSSSAEREKFFASNLARRSASTAVTEGQLFLCPLSEKRHTHRLSGLQFPPERHSSPSTNLLCPSIDRQRYEWTLHRHRQPMQLPGSSSPD